MPKTNNLVCISDIHAGSLMGLCPPDGIEYDNEGGSYSPSKLQLKLWDIWETFWSTFVPDACRKEPYAVVFVGDAIDGKPHESIAQITDNPTIQKRLAEKILAPIAKKAKNGFYFVRGTEAHVGKSQYSEEDLAKTLGAIPNKYKQYARYDLWMRVGKGLVHCLHHIGVTGSQAYEATAIGKELVEEYNEAGRWKRERPDVIVRAHRHRHISVEVPTDRGYGLAFTLAAWQLMTPYSWRIPGARLSTPQIGGSVIRQGDQDMYARHFVKTLERSDTEGE